MHVASKDRDVGGLLLFWQVDEMRVRKANLLRAEMLLVTAECCRQWRATGHSRISSLRTKLMIDGGAGNSGTEAAKTQNETVESHIVLAADFQTSSFSG